MGPSSPPGPHLQVGEELLEVKTRARTPRADAGGCRGEGRGGSRVPLRGASGGAVVLLVLLIVVVQGGGGGGGGRGGVPMGEII